MKNVHEIEIKVEGKEWEDAITKSFNKNVQNVQFLSRRHRLMALPNM